MNGVWKPHSSLSLMAVVGETKLNVNEVVSLDQEVGSREDRTDYSLRGQWLRAAILGANDGLVSTASLMMGVGAVKAEAKAMLLSGFAGLVAGACSMAIGEFVSVHSQLDIEVAQMIRRENNHHNNNISSSNDNNASHGLGEEKLPNPVQAAVASAFAFSLGAVVPVVSAGFISEHKVRMGVVAAAASLTLAVFGCVGAVLGRAPVVRSGLRVLIGGWVAMAVTFGLTKLVGTIGL